MRKSIYLIIVIISLLLIWYFLPKKIDISEKIPAEDKISDFDYYKFKSDYVITARNCKNAVLKVSVYIPESIGGRQDVREIDFSLKPNDIIIENGNKIALFEIENPDKKTVIEITGLVGVKTYDLERALKKPLAENMFDSDIKKYTSPEPFIESDDESIVAMARELKGEYEIKTVENIYSFVQQKMKYSDNRETIGAKGMLKKQRGKCTDYAMLMAALCRANGIPARVVSGIVISDKAQNHTWVEVWFKKYGWVTFEPTIISNLNYDFKHSPHKYLTLGKDITSTVVVKLKVFSEDNRPRPDVVFALEENTEFSDALNKY